MAGRCGGGTGPAPATGVSSTDLTSFFSCGSFTVWVAELAGVPLARSMASSAAAAASFLLSLNTDMHWSPARIDCRPATEASCPVTGTLPLRWFFFRRAMTDWAMPSLATSTPPMFGVEVSICSKSVPAVGLSHPVTDWFGPLTKVPSAYLGSSTLL
ncbi:MAG: hypothetical protein AUG49_16730 [Catenulispora sp. 13_1_20CM_3_70_7]|nr:MAG: hypothetical protein AUG49_16730 [Catenulispora sp. 13_1_20CM_3_70_7]